MDVMCFLLTYNCATPLYTQLCKVEAPICVQINNCSYYERRLAVTKNTSKKNNRKETKILFFGIFFIRN